MFEFLQRPEILASFAFANQDWWVLVAILGIVALALLWLGYRKSPLRGPLRWLAMSLKLIGFVLLAMALLEPVALDEQPKQNANDIVILADNSQGLGVTPPGTEGTLGESFRDDLQSTERSWLETIGDTFRLRTFVFDGGVRRTADYSDLDFSGSRSNLLGAIEDIKTRFESRPLAAIVVLSDGNATDRDRFDLNSDSDPEGDRSESAVPVFAIQVGQEPPATPDLALRSVNTETTSFEDAPVQITAQVHASGEWGEGVELVVTNEAGKELVTEPVPLVDDEGVATVRTR
ncbi:MAG: hypothetical protein AAF236_01245, partial [Verrucomicrobiota bacterium]